jgi:hypothetical protein
MNDELERMRNDLEVIQKAMGLGLAAGRDWIPWMRRARWTSLWWCLPGFICIVSALLPFDRARRHLGLVGEQWAGLLVAASLVALAILHGRQVARKDGRPEGLVREARRSAGMTTQGFWFGVAAVAEVAAYFFWGWRYHIAFEPFWAGLFVLFGSTCLVAAATAGARMLLGYGIPFLAYGLLLPLAGGNHTAGGVLFGAMFVGVALCFSLIQASQIRRIERQHESH